jgi:hypothetical protein
MAELHDVAEAIVAEGRRSFPICPSPFGGLELPEGAQPRGSFARCLR